MNAARLLVVLGAVSALLAVAAGAFGAHGLRARLAPDALAVFETAARYQIYHALGLLGAGLAHARWGAPQLVWAGWLFVLGTLLFSGSLYWLALTGARWLGALTPFGGLSFLLGWAAFAWGVLAAAR